MKLTRLIGLFVLLLTTVIFMSSCQKNVSNLPGTWRVTSAIIDNYGEDDDLNDAWTFNTDGTCEITCGGIDEYFYDVYTDAIYHVIEFHGHYVTEGNKTLTIESDKFYFDNQENYGQNRYDLNIHTLNKHTLKVSGTVKNVINGVTTSNVTNVTLTLTKQ